MRTVSSCLLLLALLFAAAPGFTGCKKGGNIVSLALTPAESTIADGTTVQFFATALFSSGHQYDWTSTVTWSSSNTAVATIGNTGGVRGLVTSVATGTTTITATDATNNLAASATLFVTKPVTISVSPVTPLMSVGTSHQFIATAVLVASDNTTTTTQDVTMFSSWQSSDGGKATITNTPGTIGNGLVTSFATGTIDVKATGPKSAVAGTTQLTITASALTSIAVTPENPVTAAGTTQQLSATGTFADGTTDTVTSFMRWSSSDTGVATVANTPGPGGLVTPLAAGTTTITATDPIKNISGSTTLTVSP